LKRDISSVLVGAAIVWIAAAGTASAQVIDIVEALDWDRPEAWATKYFNSVSLLTGLGPPTAREPWSFEIGLELACISHRVSWRGRRGAAPSGVFDLRGAESYLTVRRAPRSEKTPLGVVHRRP